MVNYSNGKIYKIQHISGEGQVYVGSTTKQYLSQRIDTHRSCYKRWKDGKHNFVTIYNLFEMHDIENCEIILLESVNANSKDELLARESYWIKQLDCVNKYIPNRTDKEYRQDNKEKIAEYKKKYQQDNKEKIAEQHNQPYLCITCNTTITLNGKSQHNKTKKHMNNVDSSK